MYGRIGLSIASIFLASAAVAHECEEPCTDPADTQALEQGLGAECGAPPGQSCALDYWAGVAAYYEPLATAYQSSMQQPGFVYWCIQNEEECYEFMQEAYHIFGIWQYAIDRANDYV